MSHRFVSAAFTMHDLRFLRLPLEGKLAAEQADEVEILYSPHPALRVTFPLGGRLRK
jgi:hypothetical protein